MLNNKYVPLRGFFSYITWKTILVLKLFKNIYLKVSVSAKVSATCGIGSIGIGIGEYLGIGGNFDTGAALHCRCLSVDNSRHFHVKLSVNDCWRGPTQISENFNSETNCPNQCTICAVLKINTICYCDLILFLYYFLRKYEN